MKSSRIFISHSSQDRKFAGLVATALRSPDMAPWIDTEQIVTGDDIFDRLGQELQAMDVLVFLVSEAALASEWVSREVKFAAKREITEKRILLLPFIIDDTPIDALPWLFKPPQCLTCRSGC
ncbi:MAG TPA: toll/interleukin-1 receptor domain-containing protein [Verrucomicrobiae bacterium]|nr:toll/interleukin-1 receptor domain-containing protein [Verrucomicrobiae bacterium]